MAFSPAREAQRPNPLEPLAGIPAWASSIALTAVSFAVLAVSALVSIRIFGRKDLA